MKPEITSRQNPKIKLVRSLHRPKARQETGLFLVEGLRHAGELAESDFHTHLLLFSGERLGGSFGPALVARFEQAGVETLPVSADLLDSLSGRTASQGLIAVAAQKEIPLPSLSAQTHAPGVALISPQDPGNLGAILRAMDAFGAGALILLDGGADPWQPAAVRASMGSLFWHPIARTSFDAFTSWALDGGWHVYGSSARGIDDIASTPAFAAPAVLLLGSEREGLSSEQAAVCERLLRIPMHGRATSLNLAVAAGILLYELTRNRTPPNG